MMNAANRAEFLVKIAESHNELIRRDWLTIGIFVGTILGFVLCHVWDTHVVPRYVWYEERALADDVVRLSAEAEAYSSVDKLHLQSQLRRRIITVKRRLNQIQARRRALTLRLHHILQLRAPVAEPATSGSPTEPMAQEEVSSTTSTRQHGTRFAASQGNAAALAEQSRLAFWREVMYYTFPNLVHYALLFGTLVWALLSHGNIPTLVGLPRDSLARLIGQCNPVVLLVHTFNFLTVGPATLQHTSSVLQQTDEVAYEATRQYLARHPHASPAEIAEVLSMRAANPYASVVCWYVLCVVVVLFAVRVMC